MPLEIVNPLKLGVVATTPVATFVAVLLTVKGQLISVVETVNGAVCAVPVTD